MKKFKVEVDCPNCAKELENEIKKISGIKVASINFLMKELSVEFEENVDEEKVMKEAIKIAKDLDDDFDIII